VARPGWLAGVVVSTLLLAGCSGDEPTAGPPKPAEPPTSPVTTTSPTPAPPVLPAAARENSKAGAVAFARHFVEVVNFSTVFGNTDRLNRTSLRSCVSCRNIAEAIADVYGAGGHVKGGELTVTGFSVLPSARDMWTVGIEVKTDRQLIQSSANSKPRFVKGGSYSLTLDVRRIGEAWRIARMERAR
jgi:hypothetical protein